MSSSLVTRDLATGLRRGPIRYPDGKPPAPYGCRWCGVQQSGHCTRWSNAARLHRWAPPTSAQILARMKARQAARKAGHSPFAEITALGQAAALNLAQTLGWDTSPAATSRPDRCEEMTHNSVGSETFCTWDDPDHDGLCDDGEGFTWLGVRNEERGQ